MNFLSSMQPWTILALLVCVVQLSLQKCTNDYRTHAFHIFASKYFKCFNVSNFGSEYALVKHKYIARYHIFVTITESNFSTVPENFIGTEKIYELNINNCDITTVGERAFEGAKLSELNLTGNGIIKIEANAFDSSYINTLILSNNSIAAIDADVFQGLSNLTYLMLDHNQIHSINGFQNLPSLTNLDLSHNPPLKLPNPQDFATLENLVTINLDSCDLYALAPNQFRSMKSLLLVNLQHNNLRLLRGVDFPETLVTLNVSDNRIYQLDEMLNITKLKELDLSDNSLYEARKFLANLTSLEKLSLQNNRLGDNFYQDGFLELQKLTLVRLDKNVMTTINCTVFENKSKLEDLSFSGNYVAEILNIDKCPASIKKLNLSHNNLESIKGLSHFKNLTSLDLRENSLSTVDYSMLKDLELLSYLDLSLNDITELHVGCFKDLANLRELHLHQNYISNLTHGVFSGLKRLSKLDLSSNELKNLEDEIFVSLRQLYHLDISSNQLSNFDVSKLIGHMLGLRTINVDGNSWSCSFLANLIKQCRHVDILEGSAYVVTNVRGIKCDSNTKMEGNVSDSSKLMENSNEEIGSKLNIIITIMVLHVLIMVGNLLYKKFKYCFVLPASLKAKFSSQDKEELQLSF